jgi:hypothetical protein
MGTRNFDPDVEDGQPGVLEYTALAPPRFGEISVLWTDSGLTLYRGDGEAKHEPTSDEWASFWTAMDRLGVWEWGGVHEDDGVSDVGSWSLNIARGERVMSCRGRNGAPSEFASFEQALNGLTGGWLARDTPSR